MTETVIEVNHVSVRFNLAEEKVDSLKEYVIRLMKGKLLLNEFYALKDVSFTVKKGEAFALVGANGSGKSTMLKVVSGIFKPTSGTVRVTGNISPLLELGTGFDYDMTARENIYLNGILLGYSKKFMQQKFDEILDFAELWEFIDVPLKNFSSGMLARLGFSIATMVKPEILIVDEILSVGDANFQKKSQNKMQSMMNSGATLLLVSHSAKQVREVCKKALWLDHGHIMMLGGVDQVCGAYAEFEERR